MLQKMRIEHPLREGRLTESRSEKNRICRPGTGNIFCVGGARKAARDPRLTEKKIQVI